MWLQTTNRVPWGIAAIGCSTPRYSGPFRMQWVHWRCNQTDKTAPKILQLESRPRGNGHRCISTGLVTASGICQSTLVSDLPMSHQSQSSMNANGTKNTFLEDPVLVSCGTRDVGGLPQSVTSPIRPGHDANGTRVSNARRSPTTDRLAHLRESYSSQGLSDEASKLMLSSKRDKTNSNYGSSFTKWANWFKQWNRDLHTVPIADVANFLSYLFSQVYQHQSLIVIGQQSLIVIGQQHMTHPVDGVSVGSHPTITRLLKGAFNTRPPLPRYSAFWDAGTVITYLKTLGENVSLNVRQLTLKTTMLLGLCALLIFPV